MGRPYPKNKSVPFCSRRAFLVMQRKVKRGALVDSGLRPNAPAVLAHDALNRGKSDAGAGKLFHRMQALKRVEQFVGVFHSETRAIIAYKVSRLAVLNLGTEFDPRR